MSVQLKWPLESSSFSVKGGRGKEGRNEECRLLSSPAEPYCDRGPSQPDMKVELLRGLKRGNRNKRQAVRVTGILRVACLGYCKLPTGDRWLGSEMGRRKCY